MHCPSSQPSLRSKSLIQLKFIGGERGFVRRDLVLFSARSFVIEAIFCAHPTAAKAELKVPLGRITASAFAKSNL